MNDDVAYKTISRRTNRDMVIDWSRCFEKLNISFSVDKICFLMGDILASEFYVPTFRNTLSVQSS